jgi:hypothetical protein
MRTQEEHSLVRLVRVPAIRSLGERAGERLGEPRSTAGRKHGTNFAIAPAEEPFAVSDAPQPSFSDKIAPQDQVRELRVDST